MPRFLPHFAPRLHVPTHHGLAPDGMQDPAGNLQLADGTYHVFPCCKWEHFSSTDLVHWAAMGPTPLGGGTGSMAVREDNTVIAMTPQAGVTMYEATDSAACVGPACLSNWTRVGPVLASVPAQFARVGDPARPWRAHDGHWYLIAGASVRDTAGHGVLYRARDATLEMFDFVTSIIVQNQTVGFGKNTGFFDMMECPDFFPIGPARADGSQKHVFISSAYFQGGQPYPKDGFHNAVTFWIGDWAPPSADGKGGQLQIETQGVVDWGAVVYYSAKSITGPAQTQNATRRLLGGWVMDSNGMSEPRLCKNGDTTPNGQAWVVCPESFHREIYLCTNTTTRQATLCQRPAPQLKAMRRTANPTPTVTQINTCASTAREPLGTANHTQRLPVTGLQLEVQLNLTLHITCASASTSTRGLGGVVGVGVLESSDGGATERTRIGYDYASRTLFVDRSRSSTLPAAVPGGGVLNSTGMQGYGQRSREVAPLPEASTGRDGTGFLHVTVLVDHSILTVFANDAAVITTRVYTAGGNSSASVSFYSEAVAGGGMVVPCVQGTVSMWSLAL